MKKKELFGMNKYFVYEHWLDDKCIYVGSGNENRPHSFERNKKYNDFVKNRENEIIVKIHSEHFDRKEAFIEEEKLANYYLSNGHELLLTRKGFKWTEEGKSKFKGDKNGMFCKTHSDEAKKKISEAFTGEKHPMYGNGWKVKGKKNGMFGKRGEKCPTYGKKNKKAMKIKAIDTKTNEIIKSFDCYREAAGYYKEYFSRKTIQRNVNGENPKILQEMNIKFEGEKI